MTKARTLADNFAADINGITASAPLTGGGTSGTVTVGIQAGTTAQSGAVQLTDSTASTSTITAATPNSVKSAYDLANGAIAKSTVDAKGDLLVGTANDTIGRLAVASTAGYVLTVDSAETTGLKWVAPAAAGFVGCAVYRSGTLSLTGGAETAITWDAEFFDTDGFHSTSTNTARFTVPSGKAGKYLFTANIFLTDGGQQELYVRKNGSAFRRFDYNTNATRSNVICDVYDLAVGDYINIGSYSGGTLSMAGGTERSTAAFIYLGA